MIPPRRVVLEIMTTKNLPDGPAVALNVSDFLRYSGNLNEYPWVRGCDVPERDGQRWILRIIDLSTEAVHLLLNTEVIKADTHTIVHRLADPLSLQFRTHLDGRMFTFSLSRPVLK